MTRTEEKVEVLTLDTIAYAAMFQLDKELHLGGYCGRSIQLDNTFGPAGAVIGDTLRFRKKVKPKSYRVGEEPKDGSGNSLETFAPIKAQTHRIVYLNYSTKDLTLSLEDFTAEYLVLPVRALAEGILADAVNPESALVFGTLANRVHAAEVAVASDERAGVSVRLVREYNHKTDSIENRLQVLYGYVPA